jgi:hypothetical protein
MYLFVKSNKSIKIVRSFAWYQFPPFSCEKKVVQYFLFPNIYFSLFHFQIWIQISRINIICYLAYLNVLINKFLFRNLKNN